MSIEVVVTTNFDDALNRVMAAMVPPWRMDWHRYTSARGLECWGGFIAGRPLYAVTPTLAGWALFFLAYQAPVKIAEGPPGLPERDRLKAQATRHYAENIAVICCDTDPLITPQES